MQPQDLMDAPDRERLLPCLRAELPGIVAGRPVMLAYLYGSVAEGRPRRSSDIDIALVLTPGIALAAYDRMLLELRIAAEVEERCGVREADVRSVDAAPLMVQGRVVSEGILLYSRDEDFRVRYEVYTRKRFFDYQPVAEAMRQVFFERVRADLRRRGVRSDG